MQIYNMLYQISYWYFIIAGVNWFLALIVIYFSLNHYLNQVGSIPVNNTFVKFLVAMIVPVIYGLGWIFFVPKVIYAAFFNKGK
ncbi:MAG: hypothetical protein IKP65_09060 [Alphaproteobacteria bacterium]|nr:hypothetical protein [Alphaproteobacteria bacterium]